MNDVTRWILALMASPILAGCSTARTDQPDDYAQGWRRARVEAIVDASTPVRSAYRDCRQGGEAGANPYVLASYAFGGNPNLRHTMAVRMASGQQPALGQAIRVNIERCETALPAAPVAR